jgi:hypothetical protein
MRLVGSCHEPTVSTMMNLTLSRHTSQRRGSPDEPSEKKRPRGEP